MSEDINRFPVTDADRQLAELPLPENYGALLESAGQKAEAGQELTCEEQVARAISAARDQVWLNAIDEDYLYK